jgi:uncharacterized protein DUF2383
MTSIPSPGFSDDFSTSNVDRDGCISQMNSLLRGEISAAETYKMAMDKLSQSDRARMDDCQCLRDMQEDHGRAAQSLRRRIQELGGQADNDSGAWGAWAKTVQGTANIFGDASALKSLKEGEEHGLKDYREALDDVDSSSAALIESELIPAQQRHISMLDRMMSSERHA